ncbi:Indole-3-acetyl-aspartic acid hydrolase [bioreactor metagenome]|uniref:Indole-3-acetyl-aspartic acid hydrolase n=1 Tax=bioreactor metagenome TaxID=1076179 RepID=A0A644SYE4_9ZZZZ|nr:amidohydrolase [Negativicutes bacterium]
MSDKITALVEKITAALIAYRRDFHRYPESGWTEFRTTAIVADKLQQFGYTLRMGRKAIMEVDMMGVPLPEELEKHMERAVRQGAKAELIQVMTGGMTGVIADLKCGEGPTVALRFDIDANDIEESSDEKHLPFREGFASQNGSVMHACGHDGHVAIGLGVAELLAEMKDEISGTIRLIFEPGEEGSRGARAMVSAGAVDGVDYILGIHIGFQAKKTGQIICGTGKFLATTKLDVTYSGKPAHSGAAPEEGKNSLLAAATCALNLHAIARHGQGATRITVGTLVAGQGRNVIPPNAFFQMETRGETSELDDYMAEQSRRIIAAAADMYGCQYAIKQVGGTKSGESSPEMITKVKEIATAMPFFNDIIEYSSFGATEDFSHFMTIVQQNGGMGTYIMIGSDLAAGHHSNYFNFDESILAPGVELMVRSVLDLIGRK